MRKHYLDNIRWATVVIVVLYHVIYMYNAEGIPGVVGKVTSLDVQYYDVFQYMVYPWFMFLLFIVSGISSRLYLEGHSDREFIRSRTVKLLVPSTIGVLVFHFIQGYVNASISGVIVREEIPLAGRVVACILSGIGVLWYIQVLWLFSVVLVPIRRMEKDRLWKYCARAGLPVMILLVLPAFGAAQILNTPIIAVYRFGYYSFAFLMGYYILSHDEVIDVLSKWFPLFAVVSLCTGIAFCVKFFGGNYADKPINRTALFVSFGYFTSIAVIGGMAKYADRTNGFMQWMNKRSFGLYVFHYLGVSSVALFLAKPGYISAPAAYLLSLVAGFGGGYLLNAVISRIPFYRWAVLGISSKK